MRHSQRATNRQVRGWRPPMLAALLACGLGSSLAPALAWQPRAEPPAPTGRQLEPVAVFGIDDRVALPAKHRELQDKLGLLFNPRSRTVCTAFCVAPDTIATAGHCLFRVAGERPPRIADFWFARNYDTVRDFARIAGYRTGAADQHVMS